MGAPKQKWTSEEEASLKAGVAKYGVGKWSTILKDPEFATVLRSRSNVDLKDKWRNLHVMANGLGSRHQVSRHQGRVVSKSVQPKQKHDDNSLLVSTAVENDTEVLDPKPLASSGDALEDVGCEKTICRLDDLILEAIAKLKEPHGSRRNAILSYIEEWYTAPPNFERLLAANLKALTDKGRLIKVRHQYRIAPSRLSSGTKGGHLSFLMDGKEDSTMIEKNEIRIRTKAQIDVELEQMKSMTAEEAAAAAAQAVADAEAAIAEAERAARIAEAAEAEAEAAQCFHEVTLKALQHQTIPV
ncbi:single myb histone 1 isoform X2 [Nicotiana tabacum]|uniref:Single myb histone 1 isoform X2 n=1 Tax=Nicotiana tabacum TaxID=4097 RepID=A0A1S4AUA7_TOBAC